MGDPVEERYAEGRKGAHHRKREGGLSHKKKREMCIAEKSGPLQCTGALWRKRTIVRKLRRVICREGRKGGRVHKGHKKETLKTAMFLQLLES